MRSSSTELFRAGLTRASGSTQSSTDPRPRPDAGVTLPGGVLAAVRPLDPGAPWIGAWRDLGAAAVDANPFYEADFALAARAAFGSGVRMLLVADRPPEAPDARLLAAWPFRVVRRWGLPLPALAGWAHPFSPLGTPLLDAHDPDAALAALLAAPRALGLPPRLLFLTAATDGAFGRLLAGRANRRAAYWAHARAVLDLAGLDRSGRAGYLAHLSGKRRRKLRLGQARLAAAGPVVLETLADPGAVRDAFEDYVSLETAGWKGRAGTALGCRPAEAAFMRAMVASLATGGRIRIVRLRRRDRTLACAILPQTASGAQAWVLKIAYDEADEAGAPGVQLMHALTRATLADPAALRIDSCAAPGYPLAETFWTGRRGLAHLLVEASGGDPLFPAAVALERARERVARWRVARRG